MITLKIELKANILKMNSILIITSDNKKKQHLPCILFNPTKDKKK